MGLPRVFKMIFGICDSKPLDDDLWSLEGNKATVKLKDMPKPLQKGEAVYLNGRGLDKPILILRTEDDRYLAFKNSCTHSGRKLDPLPREAKIRCCSIGRSTFDYEGNRISGSAKDPLTKYAVEQSNGDLIITF
jgi:cytochrome b6-f complex iron-sulfur subunit